jgi:hypothetical protein
MGFLIINYLRKKMLKSGNNVKVNNLNEYEIKMVKNDIDSKNL